VFNHIYSAARACCPDFWLLSGQVMPFQAILFVALITVATAKVEPVSETALQALAKKGNLVTSSVTLKGGSASYLAPGVNRLFYCKPSDLQPFPNSKNTKTTQGLLLEVRSPCSRDGQACTFEKYVVANNPVSWNLPGTHKTNEESFTGVCENDVCSACPDALNHVLREPSGNYDYDGVVCTAYEYALPDKGCRGDKSLLVSAAEDQSTHGDKGFGSDDIRDLLDEIMKEREEEIKPHRPQKKPPQKKSCSSLRIRACGKAPGCTWSGTGKQGSCIDSENSEVKLASSMNEFQPSIADPFFAALVGFLLGVAVTYITMTRITQKYGQDEPLLAS